jgi:hypothetical protein
VACGCEEFRPASEQYHVERWDIAHVDQAASSNISA